MLSRKESVCRDLVPKTLAEHVANIVVKIESDGLRVSSIVEVIQKPEQHRLLTLIPEDKDFTRQRIFYSDADDLP